jgi:nucleoside-diphosphate-sugar epimerase
MSRSVLLIGGAGYIGPIIAEELLSDGFQVTVLDSLIYDNKFAIDQCLTNDKFRFIQGDMGDLPVLQDALKGISHVVILAGLVGDPITRKYPTESNVINDISVKKCMEVVSRSHVEHLIFISTCSNYGLIPDGVLADETYPTTPLSLYAKSKVENEKFLLSELGECGLNTTVLRFATAFGVAPRMRFDLTINEFTRDIALGKHLLVFDPDTWRPYCHVRDFAEIVSLVLKAPRESVENETFNAGSEINNFTKRQVVDLISKHVPNSSIQFKAQGTDPRNYRVNFSKIRDVLGFNPKYTVEQGILELLYNIKSNAYDFGIPNENYFGNYTLGSK